MKKAILEFLEDKKAVLTDSHFIYTSGLHGSAYINMREVAHLTKFLSTIGREMAHVIGHDGVDVVIGPETLGRTLAQFTALGIKGHQAIWCEIVEEDGNKYARFSEKLPFRKLIEGKRFGIVDDLLTTGSSIKLTAQLVRDYGGIPVIGVAAVRRTPDVVAENCGVPELKVLADVPGFATYTQKECEDHGPCSRKVPVVLRPGHGWRWIEDHPNYPTA